MTPVEGIYTCADGGTYTITEVDGKLLIQGRKIINSVIEFDNVGIMETDDGGQTYTIKWKDTQLSVPDTDAKKMLQTTGIKVTKTGFKIVTPAAGFSKYGNLTKI